MKDNKISRRQFIKLVGAGTLFFGLGAFGIPNLLKNIREASAITTQVSAQPSISTLQSGQGSNATNATGAIVAPPINNLDIRPFRVPPQII